MKLGKKFRLSAAGALLALVAVPFAAPAAFAHDSLVSADPLADTTVESLNSVTLQFNNAPLGIEGSNLVQVKGPDGKFYETACPALDGPVVKAPVALGPAGEYHVDWRVVSSDGHPIAEEYTFTYAPSADAEAAEGSATPRCGVAASGPVEESPESGEAGADAASGDASQSDSSTGLWVGIGVGGIVVIAVAAAAWLILRKPRSTK
ncbi:copper resistance CopC family protein [Leucobacter sp. USHLN153]|uniref:copper resistance CopC family protein n=1 Tax=Leucobacter sp. USHLN153 TaxID=3081268 RepID=UPI0030168645